MEDLYLGIDTSNYKTSVAVVDSANDTVFERSEYLEVPAGKRGLRQSDAFFMHSCRLPDMIEELGREVVLTSIRAVGVSSRPRRVEGSYMPCFLSGVNAAREIAAVINVPLYSFSHQEGHAAAIIEEDPSGGGMNEESILMHLSGGTTEFLRCLPDGNGYDLEIIGGTLDISIGQLFDRAGVAMGLPFPSGPYMDRAAMTFDGRKSSILPKIRVSNGRFNLSGAETRLIRAIESSSEADHPAMIRELFDMTASLLLTVSGELSSEYGAAKIYMAGGVSSSEYIRKVISGSSRRADSPEIIFGSPALSGDNAVGIARLARRINNHENSNCNTGK